MSTDFPEAFIDLLDAEFATLATLGKDGGPQLTETWFLFENGKVKISLNEARRKTKNLAARPRCSLFILDLANPFRYLDVRGTAAIEPDADYEFAARAGAKYGVDLRKYDAPGEGRVVVTIEPTSVFAVDST